MNGEWMARFEFVSGPHDGLTFAVTSSGVEMGPEAPDATPELVRDLIDAVPEVGGGVQLRRAASLTVNGETVGSERWVGDGDIVRIGAVEAMLLEHRGAPPASGGREDGSSDVPPPLGRRCLRPGCGAINPPDAKWCATCGWDLGDPQ